MKINEGWKLIGLASYELGIGPQFFHGFRGENVINRDDLSERKTYVVVLVKIDDQNILIFYYKWILLSPSVNETAESQGDPFRLWTLSPFCFESL